MTSHHREHTEAHCTRIKGVRNRTNGFRSARLYRTCSYAIALQFELRCVKVRPEEREFTVALDELLRSQIVLSSA